MKGARYMEEIRNVPKMLVVKPEWKRPFARRLHRQKDIKMDLKEIGLDGMDWIHLIPDKNQW
jgi:hypothetical protein